MDGAVNMRLAEGVAFLRRIGAETRLDEQSVGVRIGDELRGLHDLLADRQDRGGCGNVHRRALPGKIGVGSPVQRGSRCRCGFECMVRFPRKRILVLVNDR